MRSFLSLICLISSVILTIYFLVYNVSKGVGSLHLLINIEARYGYLRPIIPKVIYQYLDCGILSNRFARVKCKACNHEYLLSFSCKRRHFCPSCHIKRVVEFGEWLYSNELKNFPYCHFVFSILKIIMIYFLFDKKLLADLARITWEVLALYYKCSK